MNNSILLNSIYHKPIPHTPVWFMRQAGRYLPEYRKLREGCGSFLNLCKNPELATQVTLQPLQRFSLDAAIMFSDILVVPEAMGMELNFIENEGPKFTHKIGSPQDIINLDISEIAQRLNYVFEIIKNCKKELKPDTPLIGFSGSPFTLACYMLEGSSSKNYLHTKQWMYNHPELLHQLLDKLTQAIIIYLTAQINAGVDVVMLFDSWGGILTEQAYIEFSLTYLHKIIAALPKAKTPNTQQLIPKIVFTKGGGIWLDKISNIGADVIGLDWTINIGQAKSMLGQKAALQGNLDPAILAVGDKNAIRQDALRILNAYKTANNGSISGHVFNLGHGILPVTNPDHVAYLVDLVHEFNLTT
ncbi:MAG: uroporphyrinogen decarboxylase [Pseudomonadota bacterium]|nr:uroporphyrinogen decarboxylase [Pseudomonadota bacterium]